MHRAGHRGHVPRCPVRFRNRLRPARRGRIISPAPIRQEGGMHINAGDTAFVLVSAALVMLMTPGLAFFYGGLVRRKNFLAIMMQSFISMGVVTTIWVLVGYSLAFSGDVGGIIGNLDWIGLRQG